MSDCWRLVSWPELNKEQCGQMNILNYCCYGYRRSLYQYAFNYSKSIVGYCINIQWTKRFTETKLLKQFIESINRRRQKCLSYSRCRNRFALCVGNGRYLVWWQVQYVNAVNNKSSDWLLIDSVEVVVLYGCAPWILSSIRNMYEFCGGVSNECSHLQW